MHPNLFFFPVLYTLAKGYNHRYCTLCSCWENVTLLHILVTKHKVRRSEPDIVNLTGS